MGINLVYVTGNDKFPYPPFTMWVTLNPPPLKKGIEGELQLLKAKVVVISFFA